MDERIGGFSNVVLKNMAWRFSCNNRFSFILLRRFQMIVIFYDKIKSSVGMVLPKDTHTEEKMDKYILSN